MSGPIDVTLATRQDAYGEFIDNASISQAIKAAMRASPNWGVLAADQREALEFIAAKCGRILNGDHNHIDSWHDISGYSRLVENRLTTGRNYREPREHIKASAPDQDG